jgi:hypothetical protein
MTLYEDALNRLPRDTTWEPDWADVLDRTYVRERRRPLRLRGKGRLVVAIAVIAAVLIPVIAMGAENDWWFMRAGGESFNSPVVVTEGSWDGHPWQFVAVRSKSEGLCESLAWTEVSGSTPESLGCGPFIGFPAPRLAGAQDRTIRAGGGWSRGFPAYVLGEVIDSATHVEIRFQDGHDPVRLPTLAAPAPFEHVRFYVAPMPMKLQGEIWETAGLDDSGNVVACISNDETHAGVSPISACE